MGREIKRVPLDFDAPLKKVWSGYLMSETLREEECTACGGSGYSPDARRLQDLWYGYEPFDPTDTGSVRLTAETPAVRGFAERNVARSPEYYGSGERAIVREANRLAELWNGMWSHHLDQDDVDALVASGRLHDFTHTWVKNKGWVPIEPVPTVTAEQVNTWSLSGFGHDAINCSVVVGAKCERLGVSKLCAHCDGHGSTEKYEGQRAEAEAWERSGPLAGEGWQLWETVSEGSPISPVFSTAEDLARWMTRNKCTVNGPMSSYDAALRFVREGWAPSLVLTPETGVIDGVEFIGSRDAGRVVLDTHGGQQA